MFGTASPPTRGCVSSSRFIRHPCTRAARWRTAAGAACRAAALPVHGSGERRAHRLGRGRSRRSDVYYLGAASGGVWKTTDSGATFAPIFDDQPSQAIGALAVAPSDSERRLGRHRRGVGHPAERRHGRRHLQVHRRRQDVEEHGARRDRPHRAHPHRIRRTRNVVYVCALGRATGPQQERGVFRRRTAARPGSACCSWTRTPAAPACRWTRRIRTCCSPARGRS